MQLQKLFRQLKTKVMKYKIWIVRIVLIILILGWMWMIFGFSGEDGDESQSLSDKITYQVINIIKPDYNQLDPVNKEAYFQKISKVVRKTAHFTEFFILGGLFAGLIATFEKIRKLARGKLYLILISAGISLVYAIVDEVHQGFVKGRTPKVVDVVIDFSGALVAILIFVLIWTIIEKGKQNEKI